MSLKAMNPYALNADSIKRPKIFEIGGRKEHRVLVIDDFFANPDALRAVALDPNRAWFSPASGYPGVFSWPDPEHMALLGELGGFLSNLLERPLDQTDQIQFSMVTKTAEELSASQRRPHFDGFNFGGLVYLNPPEQCQGGTGFYRHRATGLSRYPDKMTDEVGALIAKKGLNSLGELQKLITTPSPEESAGYITNSNSDWERICFAEMKFNRFIIYDGQIFHSGVFQDGDFGAVPVERRLTLNFFASRA